ncbi:MAG: hypothetical protein AABX13_00580 [Nanoarchaeota archaeon]
MITPTIIFNKRAITPLMITMLLISFAVAVGTGITRFGEAQLEEGAECAIETKMKLSSIGGQEQLCYNAAAKKISFTVENGLNINIEGLIVNVIGNEKADTFELNNAKMTKAGSYVGNLPSAMDVNGEIRQIKITPKLSLPEGEAICVEQAIVAEQVRPC